MQLHVEFGAVIEALENERLEYAVVGALAVAIWGAPRATTDIDLLVCRKDLARILLVAKRLGFDIIANPMKFPMEASFVARRSSRAASSSRWTCCSRTRSIHIGRPESGTRSAPWR